MSTQPVMYIMSIKGYDTKWVIHIVIYYIYIYCTILEPVDGWIQNVFVCFVLSDGKTQKKSCQPETVRAGSLCCSVVSE